MTEKELYYEADTRKHQQLVAERMMACAKTIMDRGIVHDASKFSDYEKKYYIEPVWELAQGNVEYGSEEYKRLTDKMGKGLEHHKGHNKHHPEFNDINGFSFQTLNNAIRSMDLFNLLEMLCDWIAASKRKGNSSFLPFNDFQKKYNVDDDLMAVLRNTLALIEKL